MGLSELVKSMTSTVEATRKQWSAPVIRRLGLGDDLVHRAASTHPEFAAAIRRHGRDGDDGLPR